MDLAATLRARLIDREHGQVRVHRVVHVGVALPVCPEAVDEVIDFPLERVVINRAAVRRDGGDGDPVQRTIDLAAVETVVAKPAAVTRSPH